MPGELELGLAHPSPDPNSRTSTSTNTSTGTGTTVPPNRLQVPGLVVSGARGVGKSSLLNYAAAACHQAGWLVVSIPQATDWTLGLGGRSCQAPNQAYRCADRDYFSELPLELQPQQEGSEVVLSNLPHAYDEATGLPVPNEEAVQAFLGDAEATVHPTSNPHTHPQPSPSPSPSPRP